MPVRERPAKFQERPRRRCCGAGKPQNTDTEKGCGPKVCAQETTTSQPHYPIKNRGGGGKKKGAGRAYKHMSLGIIVFVFRTTSLMALLHTYRMERNPKRRRNTGGQGGINNSLYKRQRGRSKKKKRKYVERDKEYYQRHGRQKVEQPRACPEDRQQGSAIT